LAIRRRFGGAGPTSDARLGLHLRDWFHTLLNISSWKLMLLVMLVYNLIIFGFGVIYYGIEHCMPWLQCTGVGLDTLTSAFMLSFESTTTIGFGVEDPFFRKCKPFVYVLVLQLSLDLMFTSLVTGLVLARVGRAPPRANSIVFSDKAVLRNINGAWNFMFQVCDMRKHQIIEAHVRLYAIRHVYDFFVDETTGRRVRNSEPTTLFQTSALRLSCPNDELGGMLLLAVPQVVVHRVDEWSPLISSFFGSSSQADAPYTFSRQPYNSHAWPNPLLRAVDSETGSRDMLACGVCGESFATKALLERHVAHNVDGDRASGHDVATSCERCGESFPTLALCALHRKHCSVSLQGQGQSEGGEGHGSRVDTLSHLGCDAQGRVKRRQREGKKQCRSGKGTGKRGSSSSSESSGSDLKGGSADDAMFTAAGLDQSALRNAMRETELEILVLVEGIETQTSATIQVRHSYNFKAGDIVFNRMFGQCVGRGADGSCVVDFTRFHELVADDLPFDLQSGQTNYNTIQSLG
jgi:hypothetical protein